MSDRFVKDLSDATEAWYAYADRVFGTSDVVIDAGLYDPRYRHAGKTMKIRTDLDTHRQSIIAWTAFTDAFLLARGHVYDVDKRQWNTVETTRAIRGESP